MNLFDLFVTIGLKDEASDKISGIKATTVAAGQLMANAAVATGRAFVNLSKQVVEGYSEYEQLTGGVETLFKTSSDEIVKYAENAYKTSGLSANEYMSTVTSFSASLIQSLGGDTEKAAQIADQAIVDMADNANKMGTDISMIQNAYQGFAKQNFTMLDNLKLGYGGTQQEMQRLLEDAEKISGIEYDISSFADITEAIHVMQEEMGIAGATAAEASSTIGGSVNAMKAAWQNLVVGIADENANIDTLLNNFITSVGTVADNILPVVERILGNIFDTLVANGPAILDGAVDLFLKIATGAVQAIPGIIQSIPKIIESIVGSFVDAWPQIVEVGKNVVRGIWEGIKSLAGWLGKQVSGFFSGIVGNVKDLLGIHSPSRVFASIGRNMALGVGDGWESEYQSVKNGISSGLDFGTARVGFAESGIGHASAMMRGSDYDRYSEDKSIVINLTTTLDGEVLARNMYAYNEREQLRRGTAFF